MKTIAGGMFKSETTEGMKSKTYVGVVIMNGEPTIHMYQRYFTKTPDKQTHIMRQVGEYFFCQNAVALRFRSFITLLDFVDKNKELIYKSLEIENNH